MTPCWAPKRTPKLRKNAAEIHRQGETAILAQRYKGFDPFFLRSRKRTKTVVALCRDTTQSRPRPLKLLQMPKIAKEPPQDGPR